ncbi:MAG: ion transporter [Flavobacterium sp.]|nr:ion transporter [Flavobacterium sp.]
MQATDSKWERFRKKVHIIIYGTNTLAGKVFDLVLLGVILLSVVLVMLESVKELDNKYHDLLYYSEWIITIFFTIEYILRIVSIKKPLQYIFSFYGIIDLISILPMYLSFFVPQTKILSIVRALRLLRLFRILNLAHFTGQASNLRLALKASQSKIIVFIYFVLVISILLGALMFVIEGPESGFTSIPRSIYWCIVTLTTVGYGDIAPVTTIGQLIATFVMILGYGIIAVPTGIVSAELASKSKNYATKNPCENCGTEDHRENAKYCYKCGNNLLDD